MNILLLASDASHFTLAADSSRGQHILNILKLEPGQSIRVGIAGRGLGTAMYRGGDDEGLLHFDLQDNFDPAPAPHPIRIVLGHPRLPVLSRLARDLTTLGVAAIDVVAGELSEKSYLSASFWKQGTWAEDLRLGAEQGVRVDLPELRPWYSVNSFLDSLSGGADELPAAGTTAKAPEQRILLSGQAGSRQLAEVLDPARGPCVLAVGPERGWTERETAAFEAAGFVLASLGRSVLRTETATLVAAGYAGMMYTGSQL